MYSHTRKPLILRTEAMKVMSFYAISERELIWYNRYEMEFMAFWPTFLLTTRAFLPARASSHSPVLAAMGYGATRNTLPRVLPFLMVSVIAATMETAAATVIPIGRLHAFRTFQLCSSSSSFFF